MDYLYLSEDAEGVSFFETRSFQQSLQSFAPPAPKLLISRPEPAEQLVFLTLPPGWGGPQHPSPREQIAVCLSGRLLVEAGNGEIREVGPGGVWWMADTGGSGHTSTVVGDEEVRLAIAQLGPPG